MKTYLVMYKNQSGEVSLTKLEADNYDSANKRAEDVITFINEKLSVNHKLVKVTPLDGLNDWTND